MPCAVRRQNGSKVCFAAQPFAFPFRKNEAALEEFRVCGKVGKSPDGAKTGDGNISPEIEKRKPFEIPGKLRKPFGRKLAQRKVAIEVEPAVFSFLRD